MTTQTNDTGGTREGQVEFFFSFFFPVPFPGVLPAHGWSVSRRIHPAVCGMAAVSESRSCLSLCWHSEQEGARVDLPFGSL